MHLQLDGRGSLPEQLGRAIKQAIGAGRYPPGDALPPTREMALELGVSRNSVVAAYEQLQAEGLVEARMGSGSYVSRQPLAANDDVLPGARQSGPEHRAPPSAYAARLRAFHDPAAVPGRRPPDVRHAFLYGEPVAHPALTSAWSRELARAAAYCRTGYPATRGLLELRVQICDYVARFRGISAQPQDVLIVGGTQQALALSTRLLLDAGDTAVIEEPHYFAVRTMLQTQGARVQGVPVDLDGLRTELLPARGARLVCVTPSHQFPTGSVMSLERRLALLQYAEKHDGWILEDDYDCEYRVARRPLAALRSLDSNGRVIYFGTFSKVLFPALRLGYMIVPRALADDFAAAKFLDDLGSPVLEQYALASFMANGGFERHLRRSGKALARRRLQLVAGLRRISRGRLEIAEAHAGMHLLVWLARGDRRDGERLIQRAREMGVGLFPIDACYLEPPARSGLLMGFGALSSAELEAALGVFETCLDEVFPLITDSAPSQIALRRRRGA